MNKVPGKTVLGKKRGRKISEDDIPLIHHEFMKEYGWIPLDEFKELPQGTFWNLWVCIMEDRKKQSDEMDKHKHKKTR